MDTKHITHIYIYLPSFGKIISKCSANITYRDLLFCIADLTRLQLPKCNNHLVSFIKVDGLSVPYIVDMFDTIKSRTMV